MFYNKDSLSYVFIIQASDVKTNSKRTETVPEHLSSITEAFLPAEEERTLLQNVFERYCKPPHDLNCISLSKLCRDLKLFSKEFLASDCDIVFQMTIAEVKALNENHLRHQIIFDKRIEFDVFHQVLIDIIADFKSCRREELVLAIKSADTI